MKQFGTAAILAGGMSSRMGFDKQFLQARQQRLIASLLPGLCAVFDDILVVTNRPELYTALPVRTVSDLIPGKGPLSGIHAALHNATSEYSYVMACDMPRFSGEYAHFLQQWLQQHPGADACVTVRGEWIEPFHAFYGQSALKTLEHDLAADKTSIYYLLKKLNTAYVPEASARAFSPDWSLFCNLNTREEYLQYLQQTQ
ncbi:molybdenum cofactor guanylyltransferase [Christensenellaceae bacterium OttesenSCG-928-L17]|nr:molybdenum cofactor guanylyltransferase [Christensenellaceae bacterium OttesenSCG-928-L17]